MVIIYNKKYILTLKAQKTKLLKSEPKTIQDFEEIQNKLDEVELLINLERSD